MEASQATAQNSSTITEGEAFWKQHSELLKASGLSRVKYCREYKLNYYGFGYWLKKFSQATPPSLIAVKMKPEPSPVNNVMLCTLNLANGRTLNIYDQQALALILEKLS